jgi:hypothetical protein
MLTIILSVFPAKQKGKKSQRLNGKKTKQQNKKNKTSQRLNGKKTKRQNKKNKNVSTP